MANADFDIRGMRICQAISFSVNQPSLRKRGVVEDLLTQRIFLI